MARQPTEAEAEEAPRGGRRGPGPFTFAVLLLALLVVGAAVGLEATYRPRPAAAPAFEATLPAPEAEPPANLAEAGADGAEATRTESPPAGQAQEADAPDESEQAPPEPPPPPVAPPSAPAETADAQPPAAPASPPPGAAPDPEPASPPVEPAPATAGEAEPKQEPAQPQSASEPSDRGGGPPAADAAPATPEPAAELAPEPQAPQPEAWRAHAQPFDAQPGAPRIAVLIWDLGLSPEPTRTAIEALPAEVTLGFAPYGSDLQEWVDRARAAGHEVVLQAPMEPERFPENDPGPHTLLTGLPPAKNLERLDWILGRFDGYVGVVNYMGSRFTASEKDLRPVLARLEELGLIFIDSRAAGDSVADRLAGELGLAHVANTRYLDNEASRAAIDARLEELETVARERGWALGIGYHYPVTIDRLAQWAKTLPAKGVQLAPLSAVVRQENGG